MNWKNTVVGISIHQELSDSNMSKNLSGNIFRALVVVKELKLFSENFPGKNYRRKTVNTPCA